MSACCFGVSEGILWTKKDFFFNVCLSLGIQVEWLPRCPKVSVDVHYPRFCIPFPISMGEEIILSLPWINVAVTERLVPGQAWVTSQSKKQVQNWVQQRRGLKMRAKLVEKTVLQAHGERSWKTVDWNEEEKLPKRFFWTVSLLLLLPTHIGANACQSEIQSNGPCNLTCSFWCQVRSDSPSKPQNWQPCNKTLLRKIPLNPRRLVSGL